MNNRFYLRLAAQNLRKNRKFHLPYLLTIIGTVASFYMLSAAADPEGIQNMTGFSAVQEILRLGAVVIGLVSAAVLLYTNSFLMKQRSREFGLYSILGMSKNNITRTLFWETVYTAILGIGGGLLTGVIFNRLMLMLLSRIIGVEKTIPSLYGAVAVRTALIFACFLLATFVINSGRVHLNQPVALLREKSAGEREPKARWLLALLGAVTLGGGYYIAITTVSPLRAILLFFVAVLLVIAGTFLLFLTGSTAILKFLRSRKRYYYKTRHFIAVSGLLYRMKRNAAGLAIICILSTAVLVMISSTVSLYSSIEEQIDEAFPREVMVYVRSFEPEKWQPDAETILGYALDSGFHPDNVQTYEILGTSGLLVDGGFSSDQNSPFYSSLDDYEKLSRIENIFILTPENYLSACGESISPEAGQVWMYNDDGLEGDVDFFGHTLTVVGALEENDFIRFTERGSSFNGVKTTMLVVTEEDYEALYALQKAAYGEYASETEVHVNFDLPYDLPADVSGRYIQSALSDGFIRDCSELGVAHTHNISERESTEMDYRSLYGGLLYLGIFLSVLFLAGTVLIIYYKQISEGYEDENRFEIMQKVGMSRPEIAGSIRSQMLLVFFLPLGTAMLHMAVASPMIVRMLRSFSFTNTTLFLLCVGASVAVFALIYTAVYAVTAKTYYGIVSRD